MLTIPVLRLSPILILKCVDVNEVIAAYHAGAYATAAPHVPTTMVGPAVADVIAPTYGTSLMSPTYCFSDRKANAYVYQMTNSAIFEFVNQQGVLPLGGNCAWCRQRYEHIMLGVPLSHDTHSINIGTDLVLLKRTVHSFDFIDNACGFRCAYAWALTDDECIRCGAASLLKILYEMLYPDTSPLVEAPPWRLLDKNGGTLTAEKFYEGFCTYKMTGSVLMLPMKNMYLQQVPVVRREM